MQDLYYRCEAALMWGMVLLALGLIIYLARREYRTMKRRRAHRRHRVRRVMRRSGEPMGEHQLSHDHQS